MRLDFFSLGTSLAFLAEGLGVTLPFFTGGASSVAILRLAAGASALVDRRGGAAEDPDADTKLPPDGAFLTMGVEWADDADFAADFDLGAGVETADRCEVS